MFNSCLMGELAAKTRVLVTNQLQFVSAADTVIFMSGGQVAEIGTYAEMVAAGKQFTQLMSQAEVPPATPPVQGVLFQGGVISDRVPRLSSYLSLG